MKWFDNAKTVRRSWRPLIIAGLLMIMLALAWLPLGDLAPGQRSNKPFLYVTYSVAEPSSAALEDILFDIEQRIRARHEWRLLEQQEAYGWVLEVEVRQDKLLQLNGLLQAPTDKLHAESTQRFRIQGVPDTYGALPEQYVKVLTDLIKNGHETQSDL